MQKLLTIFEIYTPTGSSSVADAINAVVVTNDSILSINWTNLINGGWVHGDVLDVIYDRRY